MKTPLTHFQTLVTTSLILLGLGLGSTPARAWGKKGHAIVGGVADLRLHSANAKRQIAEILGGETLSQVASWPDYVRGLHPGFPPPKDHPELATDADSIAFVEEFHEMTPAPAGHVVGGSGPWHTVRLPLDSEGYDAPGVAARFGGQPGHEDVVMRLQACIALLQSDAPIHGAWGKRNALRTLVHLVGDLHMPLHVGCGFFDPDKADLDHFIVRDTSQIVARNLKDDWVGSAWLVLHGDKCETLHAYWDEYLPEKALSDALAAHRIEPAATPEATLVGYEALLASLPGQPDWNSAGPLSTWPAQWTHDSLKAARMAYNGFHILSDKKMVLHNIYGKTSEGYPIILNDGYPECMSPIAEDQLARAGYRLASVLDHIWPEPTTPLK